MSVRCPRCEEIIHDKVFREIQEWGPEAMKCSYCDCPLDKSIFDKRHWNELFPAARDENIVEAVARKAKETVQQVKKTAADIKKDYL